MNHLETQENIKQDFATIEQRFPVDKWMVDGVHLWPYIRIKLYYKMLTISNASKSKSKDSLATTNSSSLLNKLNTISKLVTAFFSLEFFFLNLKNKKLLFFGSHFHRVLQDNKYFNRFFDSIVEHHNLQNDVYMVEFQKVYNNTYNQKAVIPLVKQLNNYKLLYKLKRKQKTINQDINLDDYDEFSNMLSSLSIDPVSLKITENDLLKWVEKINALKGFYTRLYKKTKPSKIILLSYYGYDDLYAALLVANSFKIKTIDFQHGPQTNVHMAYTNWLKVPDQGFNIMPKEYWNWDENSKNNIEAWANKTSAISTKVFGQPYVAYWMKRHEKLINNDNEVILYSMQTSPLELFTIKLINLIKKSRYKWIIRLHPRNNVDIKKIEEFLAKNEIISNTIIQDSMDEPLPQVLNRSVLHITNYSGCTIEANMMGVPTILVHKVGMEMFNLYIDDELVFYLDQKDKRFESKFQDLVKNVESKDTNLSYREILNPLNIN